MERVLILFFISVFFSACTDSASKRILPKETMIPLLADLHLANGYTTTLFGDSTKDEVAAVYKALYKKYATDSLTVRKSLVHYAKQPQELDLMYAEVEKTLNKLDKEEQNRAEKVAKAEYVKLQKLEAIKTAKEKVKSDLLKMSKGKYDFGLPSYKAPEESYLKLWKKYPVKKTKKDTVDSLKKPLKKRLKKEKRTNDLSPKRFR